MVDRTPPASLKLTATPHEWKMATQPNYARAVIWLRDRGVCNKCEQVSETEIPESIVREYLGSVAILEGSRYLPLGDWELDHVIPLHALPTAEIGHWLETNCQTLCQRCHGRKSAAEAKQRAKNLRLQRQSQGAPKRCRATRKVSGEVILPDARGLPWETRDGFTTIDIGKSKRR